jgi:hypothetical protein
MQLLSGLCKNIEQPDKKRQRAWPRMKGSPRQAKDRAAALTIDRTKRETGKTKQRF